MKIVLLLTALLPFAAFAQTTKSEYLQKVLSTLERIGSAAYHEQIEAYAPGDTIPATFLQFTKESVNPADTTIGSSFLKLDNADTTHLDFGYDGKVLVYVEDAEKEVRIDDFSTRNLPFRLVGAPFFNLTANLIRYALTTTDRIETQLEDKGDEYLFRLTIREDRQVEFFGKAYHMPENPYCFDPTSIYELWIRKSDDLPYKLRREMEHQTSVYTVSEVSLSPKPGTPLSLEAYFPADYKIRRRGESAPQKSRLDLTGKQAPDWTLTDAQGRAVSLGDFRSRVLLINFTGIGCGACHTAIPFLNELKTRYPASDLEIVAVETWGKSPHSVGVYSERNNLNYKLLAGADPVVKSYLPDSAVPVFMLLDENRIVRNLFNGFGRETSDEAITKAIDTLLQE